MFTGLASFVARAYPRSIRRHHTSAVFTPTFFQCASSSRIINRGAFSFLINLSWHPRSKPASTCRHIPVSAFSFCAQWLPVAHPVLYARLSGDENTECLLSCFVYRTTFDSIHASKSAWR